MRPVKIVVCGQSGVGKSTLMKCLRTDGGVSDTMQPTIGIDFWMLTYVVSLRDGTAVHVSPRDMPRLWGDEVAVSIQVWDTAGVRSPDSIQAMVLANMFALVVVYDITDASSFVAAKDWLQASQEIMRRRDYPDAFVLVVGNKLDLADTRRQVSRETASALEQFNFYVAETSARSAVGVHEMITEICLKAVRNYRHEQASCVDTKSVDAAALIQGRNVFVDEPPVVNLIGKRTPPASPASGCGC